MTAYRSGTFETVALCPGCGTVAIHLIRRPRVCLVHPDRGERETVEIGRWGYVQPDRVVVLPLPGERHEQRFEVIRVCRCGHEWGQAER